MVSTQSTGSDSRASVTMKFLVLLFVVGCVSAFAPRNSYDDVLETAVDEVVTGLLGDAPVERLYRSEDDGSQSELEKKVREAFEKALEQVKEAIERGKAVREDVIEKLKELKQKMKDMKIDISEKAKDLYKKIREKAKDFLQKLLDKLGMKDEKRAYAEAYGVVELEELMRRAEDEDNDSKKELEKKVREAFDRLLEKIKDAVERGKTVKEDVLEKLGKLKDKMKEMKIDVSERAKDLYQKIKEKAKDFFQNLLDRLGLKDTKEERAVEELEYEINEFVRRSEDEDSKSELEKKVREAFDNLLEKVKDAIERGKTVREDVIEKMKKLKEKMKDLKIDVSERAKEMYKKIKEKAKDFLQNLLDRLGLKDNKEERTLAVEELIRRAEGNDLEQKVRDAFDKLLEKVKEAVEQGKTVREDVIEKMKGLREKMKELKIDMSDKAKELFQKLKDRAKDFIKNLLDKLGHKEESYSVAQADFNIKNIFKKLKESLLKQLDAEKIKQKIEELFGKGNELAENLLELLKTKGESGKQKLLDLVDRILGEKEENRESRSIQEVYDKVRNYFKNLGIELKERYVKFGHWVKETVKKGIDASKNEVENVKAIAKEFVENANKARKDIAVEALEFLRPYKEDLGTLWVKVKDSVKEVLNRHE